MDFDPLWLLVGPPIAFALGWAASRIDARQWRRERGASPQAWFKGLNLLLNEQPDKAIDAFIEAVQQDPHSSDLHFALGNLFRRRGEFERAVRVHEHLLARADLPAAERQRAQHALAHDFMKAGLIDRAEQAFRALEGTPFETESRLALLGLHERARDWRAATEAALQLEKAGTGSFATRIAHHWCELALEADERGQPAEAEAALQRAREAAPHAARPLLQLGQRHAAAGRHDEALHAWDELMRLDPAAFLLVADDYAASAAAAGRTDSALAALAALHEAEPHVDLLHAMARIDGAGAASRLRAHVAQRPTLVAAAELLALAPQASPGADDLHRAADAGVQDAVARAARPLRRFRCAACGFEAQRHFWQCPGCLSWDSYPPQRPEEP